MSGLMAALLVVAFLWLECFGWFVLAKFW